MAKRIIISFILLIVSVSTAISQDYWNLFFQPPGSVKHEALLVKSSNLSWIMRVRFYSETCSCYDVIEQKLKKENTSKGFRLAGYDPVYANTQIEHSSYIADNFYFEKDENGDTVVFNLDDAGVKTAVTGIRQITDYDELKRLRLRFRWY